MILAHNYQPAEIQDLADFCGDSLGLSIEAVEERTPRSSFSAACGLWPRRRNSFAGQKGAACRTDSAGCPMADMITAEQL